MRTIGWILGVIVGGLVLYVVWSLITGGGTAQAATTSDTLRRTSGASAKPFQGVYGETRYTGFDTAKNRVLTDKGTFFSATTPKLELKEQTGFSYKTNLSGLYKAMR